MNSFSQSFSPQSHNFQDLKEDWEIFKKENKFKKKLNFDMFGMTILKQEVDKRSGYLTSYESEVSSEYFNKQTVMTQKEIMCQLENDKLRDLDKYRDKQFILYPDDPFWNTWDIIMTFLLIYAAFIIPYELCFMNLENKNPVMRFISLVADIIFIGDVFVNFYTAYYDENDELVVDQKAITSKYLRGWFFMDLIASIPFDILIDLLSDNNIIDHY